MRALLVAVAVLAGCGLVESHPAQRPATTDDQGREAVGGADGGIVGWLDPMWSEERIRILLDAGTTDLNPALLAIVEDDDGDYIGYLAGDGFHPGGVTDDGWPTEATLERVYGQGSTVTTAVGDD